MWYHALSLCNIYFALSLCDVMLYPNMISCFISMCYHALSQCDVMPYPYVLSCFIPMWYHAVQVAYARMVRDSLPSEAFAGCVCGLQMLHWSESAHGTMRTTSSKYNFSEAHHSFIHTSVSVCSPISSIWATRTARCAIWLSAICLIFYSVDWRYALVET